MQIDYDILIAYGGVAKKFDKGESIFREGALAQFYYQIVKGEVRVFSTNDDGKELIQGIFSKGQSFGEPPFLLSKPYPSSAVTTQSSVVVKIGRDKLNSILADYPEIVMALLDTFAARLFSKACAAQVWVCQSSEQKIEQFFCNYRNERGTNDELPVPYTRQQIADFTGLRVETVIRTIKNMSNKGLLKIIDHKIYC